MWNLANQGIHLGFSQNPEEISMCIFKQINTFADSPDLQIDFLITKDRPDYLIHLAHVQLYCTVHDQQYLYFIFLVVVERVIFKLNIWI